MTPDRRTAVIAATVTPNQKTRFAAEAQASGLSDSTLAQHRLFRTRSGPTPGQILGPVIRSFLNPSAPHTTEHLENLIRAADLTSDLAGLLPTEVATDSLVKVVDAERYLVNAGRQLPMPVDG